MDARLIIAARLAIGFEHGDGQPVKMIWVKLAGEDSSCGPVRNWAIEIKDTGENRNCHAYEICDHIARSKKDNGVRLCAACRYFEHPIDVEAMKSLHRILYGSPPENGREKNGCQIVFTEYGDNQETILKYDETVSQYRWTLNRSQNDQAEEAYIYYDAIFVNVTHILHSKNKESALEEFKALLREKRKKFCPLAILREFRRNKCQVIVSLIDRQFVDMSEPMPF